MKKIIATVFVLFAVGFAFAQEAANATAGTDASQYDERTIRVIVPEKQHITDKTASVRIEYRPMYDDARIYYTSMYVTYDKGEAMNTVMACLQDFMVDNQYYHYQYMARDRERYYKNENGRNMAEYMSYVKFTR